MIRRADVNCLDKLRPMVAKFRLFPSKPCTNITGVSVPSQKSTCFSKTLSLQSVIDVVFVRLVEIVEANDDEEEILLHCCCCVRRQSIVRIFVVIALLLDDTYAVSAKAAVLAAADATFIHILLFVLAIIIIVTTIKDVRR